MTTKTYDKIARDERKYVAQAGNNEKSNGIVMCVGTAGTGVGLRIGGHARRGGAQVRKRHRRYVPVAMTDEHGTSQTCSVWFSLVVRQKRYKTVKGKEKLVSVNGSSLCLNNQCPRYSPGINTMNRDAEAARCIALGGVSRMIAQRTLPPFISSTSSQSNTAEFSTYHVPRTECAPSVPSNGIQ